MARKGVTRTFELLEGETVDLGRGLSFTADSEGLIQKSPGGFSGEPRRDRVKGNETTVGTDTWQADGSARRDTATIKLAKLPEGADPAPSRRR